MKHVIFKYPLTITDRQELILPAGSRILSVKVQHGGWLPLKLWSLVTDSPEAVPVNIYIFGTGNPIPKEYEVYNLNFIDTVLMGELVWHVFTDSSRVG